jgi:hypothetical protein
MKVFSEQTLDKMSLAQSNRKLKSLDRPDSFYIEKSANLSKMVDKLQSCTITSMISFYKKRVDSLLKEERRKEKVAIDGRRRREKIARDKRVSEINNRIAQRESNLEKQPVIRPMNRLPSK